MNQASAKQVALITRLATERDAASLTTGQRDALAIILDGRAIAMRDASALITALFAAARVMVVNADAPIVAGPLALGVYVMPDETIVKVNAPKGNAERRYAKIWREINGERALDAGGRVNGDWDYAPGLIASVRAEYAMTREQACAFGVRYGRCVRCGRVLVAAESVERAIGPVCWKAFR